MIIKFSAIPGTRCPNISDRFVNCGSQYCIQDCPHRGSIFIEIGKPYVLKCNFDEINLTEHL